MTTEYFHEQAPGQSWLAGQPGITAGMDEYQGLTVYAGWLGLSTVWATGESKPVTSWTGESLPATTEWAVEAKP